MGRKPGSKNLKTLEKEANAKIVEVVVEEPIKMVREVKEFNVDGAMLKRWLQGVKADYKENKIADEKYLNLINEILDYLKRMENKETYKYKDDVSISHATKETSNIEARNDTTTD